MSFVLTAELLQIVLQAHSLERILDAACRLIAARLRVNDCVALLADEQGRPVLGRAADRDAAVAEQRSDVEAIAARVIAERRFAAMRTDRASLLASPMLLKGAVRGVLVLLDGTEREFSVDDIAALEAAGAQLVGIVENARVIEAMDRGELARRAAAQPPPAAASGAGELVLRGIAASPGVVIATAVFRRAYRLDLRARDVPSAGVDAEKARARTAFEKTRNDLTRIQLAAAREVDEEHALIFASHFLLLSDPGLARRVDTDIERGSSAAQAIDAALEEFETRLRLVPDAYIQDKVDDVDDLRTRLLEHALDTQGRTRFGARVVVTRRLAPSLVVELKTEGAQALVTETGGTTSHGTLLARAMGIPTVTGIADTLRAVYPGDRLIVDGTHGVVVVRPSEQTVARYEAEIRSVESTRRAASAFRDRPGCTADGVRVTLLANVGIASDLVRARDNGAEGIGLYRTEFPFIVRDAFPTLGEQVGIYKRAYELFPEGPIHFRILDLGGDKFVGRRPIGERNAFHGYRSIRVLFDYPEVLRDQVQALALAALGRPISILIPMVTSLDELRRAKALIDDSLVAVEGAPALKPRIGAMIEVPAAVELAGDIAGEVDFLSIGTNDLMQYTLVVDREDSRMAALSDPYHPAILRMVVRVITAAHARGKPVGVCGEIAARPDLAVAMVALGIDSLSVVPTAIPALKETLACVRIEPVRRQMTAVLAFSDAQSLGAALRETIAASTVANPAP